MRSMRHANPLVDVRRPRHNEQLGLNPPGFIWKPLDGVDRYRLQVARHRAFADCAVDVEVRVAGRRTLHLLDQPLAVGRWFWRWGAGEKWSQVFAFTILPDAADARLGSATELAARLGPNPRAMTPPGGPDALRLQWAGEKADRVAGVLQDADELLKLDPELAEPPFLPDERSHDYNVVHVPWRKAMQDTRSFCTVSARLAFAYLVSGRRQYADAVAARLDSLAAWDPDGSTSISHNDEPHMAVMDGAILAFDWVADAIEGERLARIVRHLGRRSENTYRWLLENRNYGIDRFDSHSGRMLGFLGQAGISLMGHDQRAAQWLGYVLELMVAMYPAWGLHEGGWGEGFSYCSAYMRWNLQFVYSVKTALGLDLYRKPFYRNHARWWAMACPEYSPQTPFGDGGDTRGPGGGVPLGNAAVIAGHLGLVQGDPAVVDYSVRCIERGRNRPGGHGVSTGNANLAFTPLDLSPLLTLPDAAGGSRRKKLPRAEVFHDVGYVAMRSDPTDAANDIALAFKSSPYGPISHSHGDQNCLMLWAFGEPLLIRTGYYTGYSNPHHHNWVRQTKAHNGVTVSGVGQWVRCDNAGGRIAAFARKPDHAIVCGDASGSYGQRVSLFHRHVLFVDYRYFLVVDDLAAPVPTTYEFHLHALEPMAVDHAVRAAQVRHGRATLDVRFLCPLDMRLYASEGFDPPNDDPGFTDLPTQYHLRAATVPPLSAARSAMLLIPNREQSPEPIDVQPLAAESCFGARVARGGVVDELRIAVAGSTIAAAGTDRPAIALWLRDGNPRAALHRPR
ncbi:MAG: hypothetical protein BIFFINMI_01567 [Phycisphaerae bacterium]|nr:hypothetical protein [Phycisphaerae bacterium]